ncbi:MAG: adenylate cyclase [Lachnospiraceae bacterium]|nr:adenylate cyclase [Lachnospiraceae bacterium]
MGFEIERKWLPKKEDAEKMAKNANHISIEQGYICTDPVIRIRKEGENHLLTCKGEGFLVREEINLRISPEAYDMLLTKCENLIIKKERYTIPYEDTGLKIELDLFKEEHEGLIILEIEFPDEESAKSFCAPECFGVEVTGDARYTNACLSLQNP